MLVRYLFAVLHLLGLAIGVGAVWARGRALAGPLDQAALKRALYADNWWGIAALLWWGTGLPRAFLGLEKGTAYYLQSGAFQAKMAILLLLVALEIWPMVVLIRWRYELARGEAPDLSPARAFARISYLEAVLTLALVLAAAAMARGMGA